MPSIADNIARVRERPGRPRRAGRGRMKSTVAVTKTFGADVVREVIRGGVLDIGENRVQELVAKQEAVGDACRWHLVGPLQRNKAGKVVGRVELIHSIDGVRIAETVDRIATRGARVRSPRGEHLREASKHGVSRRRRWSPTHRAFEALDWARHDHRLAPARPSAECFRAVRSRRPA
jgi:uncharacterized pyridoxal phosphate-containing UPF0001 family protein